MFVSLRQVVMFLCLVLPGPLIEFSFEIGVSTNRILNRIVFVDERFCKGATLEGSASLSVDH